LPTASTGKAVISHKAGGQRIAFAHYESRIRLPGRRDPAPDQVQEALQMMSGRAYAIRLTQVVFIFAVVIPALAVGLVYAIEATRSRSGNGLVWEYIIIFLGTPLWLLCFAIALGQVVHRRARTVGLPFWVSLLVLIQLAADGGFFLSFQWSFRPFFAPFLLGAFALLIALAFWPERAEGASPRTFANDCAIWALAGLGVLACASFVGSLIGMTIGTMMAVQIDGYARFAARWWVFLAIGAMIFTIVAGRRKIRRE
jgi:hypothetical protein